jgi:hypothetical protein
LIDKKVKKEKALEIAESSGIKDGLVDTSSPYFSSFKIRGSRVTLKKRECKNKLDSMNMSNLIEFQPLLMNTLINENPGSFTFCVEIVKTK